VNEPLREHRNGKISGFFQSNLFIFLLGQFCMFVFWLLGFAVTYGETQQKNKELDQWRGQIEIAIRRMDDQGTNYSHYTLQSDHNIIQSNSQRIEKLESAIGQLPVMNERVTRLTEEVRSYHETRPK
jgi:hypothetical protein